MFKKQEWENFKEMGNRETSFDWDISHGYITFGSYGMTVYKMAKHHWTCKTVNDWRNKSCKEVNNEIKNMVWEEV